jgi:hypothetical protein
MKPAIHRGYPRVFVRIGTRRCYVSVHVMVCETFHGPRPDGMQAAHENGVRIDCRASNLSWKTRAENQRDMIRHGTLRRGEQITHLVKLTAEVVHRLRAEDPAKSHVELASVYGTTPQNIGMIRAGKTWRHLPGAPVQRSTS